MKFLAPTTPEISEREKINAERVRKLSVECMVLLKNDGTLPLKERGKIALYGNGARATVKGGTGSGDVYVRETVNIETGLEREGFEVTTKAWLARQEIAAKRELEEYSAAFLKKAEESGNAENAQMLMLLNPLCPVALAEITDSDILESNTDTAVYVLSRNSGEGKDRRDIEGDYELSDAEVKSIALLAERYEKLIVLLNIGGVIDTKELRAIAGINSIVLIGQLGNVTGLAVADLLSGAGIPSGKLTDTWAENYSDYPSSESFGMNDNDVNDEYYTEGIYVGYRYFDTFGVKPAYEFGYGGSYTDFDIKVRSVKVEGTEIAVEVEVKNVGSEHKGKETVQVYVSAPRGKIDKPYQELRGFAKTRELYPGEKETLTVTMKAEAFASYCEACASYVLEAGDYIVRVGNSSRNTAVAAVITLSETVVTEKLRNLFDDPDGKVKDIVPAEGAITSEIEAETRLRIFAADFRTDTVKYAEDASVLPKTSADHMLTFEEVANGNISLDDFIAQLSDGELAYLAVGNSVDNQGLDAVIGSASKALPGAAGETTGKLENRTLRQMELCDGPAGLRLAPKYIETPDGNAVLLTTYGADNDTVTQAEDIVHYQYLTAIPIATTLASSWNLELLEECGDIVGGEMMDFGATLWLAPGMNIHRNPLCGRNFEYYSEDPLLSGKCAAADTFGVQKHTGVGTTIKHFFANNQEDNRMFTNSHVSERAIREIYTRNFRIAVQEAQPMSIMTSYNLINGTHAANSVDALRLLLRDEWGFEGVVMTDWLTTSEMAKQFSAITSLKYPKSDPALCIKAQNDLIEPGMRSDHEGIMRGLSDGVITRAELELCAKHILTLMLRSHLYSDKSYYENVELKNISFR